MPERRHDIDWLRVLGMLTIFLFHCARFFNEEDWHVKNFELSYGMTIFVGVLSQWIMPLFFVLSGISAYYALVYLKGGRFLNARVKRLAVPLIFGIFTHIPLQVYFERVTHSQFTGSFIEFLPHYFDGWYEFGGNFAWMGLHLWYLGMLFLFSLITLPLLLWVRKGLRSRPISKVAGFCEKTGAIFLLAVPIIIMELLGNLQPDLIGNRGWGGWSILPHLMFFLLGYLVASDSRFKPTLERQRTAALAMGITTTVIGFFLLEYGEYSSRAPIISFVRGFNSWFWLVAILGFGSRYLSFNSRVLKYANEAVLPFYILHQTVILVVGFYLVRWQAGVAVKYVVISTTSLAAILGLYDVFVKRANVMRFLFGMKLKKRERVYDQPSSLNAETTPRNM